MDFFKNLLFRFRFLTKKQKRKKLTAGKKRRSANPEVEALAQTLQTTSGELFLLSKKASSLYKEVKIPKKRGGFRTLHTPNSRLKELQRKILQNLLSKEEFSSYATAYCREKNLRDNASPHVGHLYLLKMDVSDFFGSITFRQVLSCAFPSTRYSRQCGVILASLCTKDGFLPQGAPTSPALSNLVMKNFDEHLGTWCEERGIVYTRYCDDLTFSADYPLLSLSYKVSEMLSRWGFRVNEEKTKFIYRSSCQRVTGLCVNEKVSVPSEYKRGLRQDVYYALRFGLEDSMRKSGKAEYFCDGKWDTERYLQSLLGKINFVLQIEPQNRYFTEKKEELKQKFSFAGENS